MCYLCHTERKQHWWGDLSCPINTADQFSTTGRARRVSIVEQHTGMGRVVGGWRWCFWDEGRAEWREGLAQELAEAS